MGGSRREGRMDEKGQLSVGVVAWGVAVFKFVHRGRGENILVFGGLCGVVAVGQYHHEQQQ